ncbi:D-glycerate dehydrogenase|uniref:Phosphonate dehydrogenase n=1 Tax=Dendrosporobacter quercicolus TaxID=146817 RepID=A0A1G9YBB6_9FIRM|nr:D-glycerate dehydrogenase [Dendrosporobacter quercicolus]NSL47595.1 D-glycerate dehydrogenase [Dendrosporobacter quercicolus DSM 1736]SDN06327.1 phosphonate dehydrogenase [Dendrosporobacter quercicolus]
MMSRKKVFVGQFMPDRGLAMLRQYFDVSYCDGASLSKEEFMVRAREVDALVAFMTDYIDRDILANCPGLKVIASFGKGFDNIDVQACTRQGILVTVNPDDLTASTAELAMTLLLALSRNVLPADTHIRAGHFQGWHPLHYLGSDVHGKTLGLVGFGAIGQAIARRAKGFEVNIRYYDSNQEAGAQCPDAQFAELPDLLAESDYVVIAVSLNPGSRHLLGAKEIALLKKGSYLINIGRGSTVDEAAVAEALLTNRLRGYAADVFAFEDQSIGVRPAYINDKLLRCSDRTVFTPHLGTGTVEARDRLSVSTARQLISALKGARPSGAVNYDAIYGV